MSKLRYGHNAKENSVDHFRPSEVREIMTDVPSSVVRWGVSVLAAITIIFLSVSWMIRYPDTLHARVITTSSSTNNQTLVARAELPKYDWLKVKNGQQVNMTFDIYPSQQYGGISGHVSDVFFLPHDGKYYVTISLPENPITNLDKTIVLKHELSGTAEIVSENMRLSERLWHHVTSIFKPLK